MPTFTFSRDNLVHSAPDITQYVEGLISLLASKGLYYRGPNRRADERHRVTLSVKAIPLDQDLKQIGDEFTATTRDISNGGISIIHSAQVDGGCRFLAVELVDSDGKPLQAALEILRSKPVGPFFEIAGKFVTKVQRFDPFANPN